MNTYNNTLQSTTASPFDAIRQTDGNRECWSARDLQTLLGYVEWRKFEDAIERAIAACKNVGQNPEDHFVNAANMIKTGKGATRKVTDYHLSRYACYLTAMNGDPRKEEIAQAQTYFAIKTYEAETARPLQGEYTISDALRERAALNEGSVPTHLFAVQIEFERELYHWEKLLNQALDASASIELSLGRHWSTYARTTLHIPESERERYKHACPGKKKPVEAYGYPIKHLPAFRQFLSDIYFPVKFPAYQRGRARRIGVQLIAPKGQKRLTRATQLTLL